MADFSVVLLDEENDVFEVVGPFATREDAEDWVTKRQDGTASTDGMNFSIGRIASPKDYWTDPNVGPWDEA